MKNSRFRSGISSAAAHVVVAPAGPSAPMAMMPANATPGAAVAPAPADAPRPGGSACAPLDAAVVAPDANHCAGMVRHRTARRAVAARATLRGRLKAALPLLLTLAAAFAAAFSAGPASAMQPLADGELAAVRGRDGVSFDLNGFAMNGDVRVTYTAPNGASIYKYNLSASRSDSGDPFSDPYRIDIVPGAPGMADVMQLAFPANGLGEQRWQFAYDWGMQANGVVRDNGAVVLDDVVFRGGGLQFSTPQTTDGIAWGAALRVDIGQLAYRMKGRADAGEQMAFRNIQLGAVDANGNFTGGAWQLAHVASQPGILNAYNDVDGPRLHLAIDWPDARYGDGAAPAGGLAIGNLSFNSASGNVDLGSSRIGSMQIQYLDIKFRR